MIHLKQLSTDELEKVLDELDRERFVMREKSTAVEQAYCARFYAKGREQPRLGAQEEELFRDSLHEVQVPEIEPRFVKKAWKEHRKAQKQYLSWFAETEATEPQQTGELDEKGEGEGEPSHFPTS